MFLADYHVHSNYSKDCAVPMADMAAAGVAAGVSEICFTDHLDMLPWEKDYMPPEIFDSATLLSAYEETVARLGDRITVRLGLELGDIAADPERADRYLRQAPPLDFLIGSVHVTGSRFNHLSLTRVGEVADQWDLVLDDYLEAELRQVEWGKFSVIGHLTLPLRYGVEKYGLEHLSFRRHMDGLEQVLRRAIEKGIGIECNTNRGHMPLPGREVLTLYRQLGGEIITLGSDAHRDYQVGKAVADCQELLRQCGFSYFCTYEKMKPIFHKL